jgi:hypothetical protein
VDEQVIVKSQSLRARFDMLRKLTWFWFAIFAISVVAFTTWHFVLPKYYAVTVEYWWVWMLAILGFGLIPGAVFSMLGVKCVACPYRFRGWFLKVAVSGHTKYRVRFCPGCGLQIGIDKSKTA